MTPKLNFVHICDYASFSEGGKLNILGIFENINSTVFPYQHPQFFIVANILISEPGEYECVIRLADPKDLEINKFSLPKIKIATENSQNNIGIVGQFNGVKFDYPGDYKVTILIDGRVIDSRDIKVIPNVGASI